MKTDVVKVLESEKAGGKNLEDQKITRGMRRSLHPLQQEAGDKENLVGGGRITRAMAPNKVLESIKNPTSSKIGEPSAVTYEDLTTEGEPSKAYWETLAEKRRLVLEEALQENKELHQRVALLEEENKQCKILLEETRTLVDTLTDILNNSDVGDQDSDTSSGSRNDI